MATTEQVQGTMTVAAAAEAFAGSLHESAAWRSWEQAQARFQDDFGIKEATARMDELSRQFRSARAQGQGLRGPELAELNRLQTQLQESPLARERDAAAQALLGFLQDANRLLSEALGIDFAANAAPRQSNCCG